MTTAGYLLPNLKLERAFFEKILIAAMFTAVAFDMGGEVGVRDIVISIGAALLVIVRRIVIPREFSKLFALLVVYPTFLLLVGIMKGADLSVAISQYRSTVLAFILLIILSDSSYDFLAKSLYYSIGFTAFVAIVFAVSLALGMDLFGGLIGRFHENSVGYFGLRGIGEDFIPNISFKSTLFYVPAALYFLFGGRHLLYIICVLGLVAGVSKTGIVIVLVGSMFYIFSNEKMSSKLLIMAILFVVLLFIFQSPIMQLFIEIQEGRSASMDARIGHFSSILKLFSDHPLGLLFGFGLGTEFYTEGLGQYVSNIELDHLNCIRKYGLIWACIFFWVVLNTSIRSIKSNVKEIRILGGCLLSAFIVAGTNPVLISPVFFLVLFVTMSANIQSASRSG